MSTYYTNDKYFSYAITETEAIVAGTDTIEGTEYTMPDYIEGIPVTGICGHIFSNDYGYRYENSQLETLVLPKHCKFIGDECFEESEIQHYILNNELECIGARAFYWSDTKDIYIPSSLKTVKDNGLSHISKIYIDDLISWFKIDFQYSNTKKFTCGNDFFVNNILVKDIIVPNEITVIKPFTFLSREFK